MSKDSLNSAERSRYARHLLLEHVGPEGQARLKASSVLCIGAGGLGSPVLLYLAAAGVGRIGIVDPDVVEVSNLQRQILHGDSTLGHPKVHSAKARLLDINPHLDIQIFEKAITRTNALELLADWDVVVDGTDNFPTRYLVNDACVILGKPLIYGSIYKFEGQLSVFNYQGGPNYRDLFPEPPPPNAVPSCAEGGVLGVLPGVVGSIQATETLKVLLEIGETLSGRLLLYDALNMRFRELKLSADPKRPAITELIDYDQFCKMPHTLSKEDTLNTLFSRMPVAEASEKLNQGWKPYVLDVRRPAETEIVAFDFSDRIHPHDQIHLIAEELPRDRDILVHCKLGKRSDMACEALAALGFNRLFSLDGGIVGWAKEIDPDMPTY